MDSTTGHELLNFMNAYSVYNQIYMHLSSEKIPLSSQINSSIVTRYALRPEESQDNLSNAC